MTQYETIRMARELATRHGNRMCDEDGDTHGEELYCVGIEDIAEIIKQVAAQEREACAKVCEEVGPKDSALKLVSEGFAAAIRARNVDSVGTTPECVEKTAECVHDQGGSQHAG